MIDSFNSSKQFIPRWPPELPTYGHLKLPHLIYRRQGLNADTVGTYGQDACSGFPRRKAKE
jgi:hypothetical protein